MPFLPCHVGRFAQHKQPNNFFLLRLSFFRISDRQLHDGGPARWTNGASAQACKNRGDQAGKRQLRKRERERERERNARLSHVRRDLNKTFDHSAAGRQLDMLE